MNGTLDDLLKTETDQRLLRLFAVGCCRQIWPLIKDQRSRTVVKVAEKFADGQATQKELNKSYDESYYAACLAASNAAWSAVDAISYCNVYSAVWGAAYDAANATANTAAHSAAYAVAYSAARAVARQKQLELYHCLFTKIVFTTTSPNALNLAKLIYLERNWSLMPILGDALEEAGVSEEAVSHCKEKEHARGCWVVDNLSKPCAGSTRLCRRDNTERSDGCFSSTQ